MKKQKLFLLSCAAFLCGSGAYAQTDSTQVDTEVVIEDDFFDMELEDFLNNIYFHSFSNISKESKNMPYSLGALFSGFSFF